jgi:beta-lactamase regulating signal transducer with metallopeptidase domain
MSAFVDHLNQASATWVERTAAVVWQSLFLGAVVMLACHWLRRSNPAARYWLWQIVAIKLIVMPLWTVSVAMPFWWSAPPPQAPPAEGPDVAATNGPTAIVTLLHLAPGAAPEDAAPATPSSELGRMTWQSWLVLAWLAGVASQGCRLLVQRCRLSGLLRRANRSVDLRLSSLVGDLAARLGLTQAPRIAVVDFRGSPFVCGLFRPVLVLPLRLLQTLDNAQLRLVLLHELAHVRRRDLLWGWLPEIARVIYFFHPLAYYACYRIRLERELACDQIAMRVGGGGAADYADTLISVVRNASPFTLTKPALLAKESLS